MFGIEFAYREPLYQYSIRQQIALQPNITKGGLFIFEALSFWGNGAPYFLAFFVIFVMSNRPRAFYYVLFLTACGFLMNITKMAYHEPRPFMYTREIKVYGCSAEYGNPSGHSLFAAAFNFFFFLDICHSRARKVSNFVYFSLLFNAVLLTVFIGFARFYVGVHTLNQIVYGWQLGLLLAFYFHFCLQDLIIRHITFILSKSPSKIPFFKYISMASVIAAISFISQILTYFLV